MKKYTRDQLIEKLIEDDINTQKSSEAADELYNILKNGFRGYDAYTDGELIEEYNTRTDEEWNFIK